MKACIIAYTFYEVDPRVRRYAEALVERGTAVDVIVLKRKGQKDHGILNGVNIFRIQERSYNEKSIYHHFSRVISFFIKGSTVLFVKHLRYRYKLIHIHNVPDFLIF
ncbi:MAG: hypothetical protein ACFFCW_23755, partial [Candidatus Hodarchaeota archaeon]